MKVSIIKPDGIVSKDGVSLSGLSLSSIASDVWAVHWDSSASTGTVEKTDLSVTDITSFTPYESAITEFDAAYKAPVTPSAEEVFKIQRNAKLAETDWMGLSDVTMSDAWKTYRQALRDLPANTSDWENPTYPTEPT